MTFYYIQEWRKRGEDQGELENGTGVAHVNRMKTHGDKEIWWWNDMVQEVIKVKKEAKKTWETPGRQDDIESYRQARKLAMKAVATAKARSMN